MKYLIAIMGLFALLLSGCFDEMPMTPDNINKLEDCIQQQREQVVTGGICHLVLYDDNSYIENNYVDACVCVRKTKIKK